MPKFAVRRYLECGEKRQSRPILCPRSGFQRTANSRRPSPSSWITDGSTAGSRLPVSFGAAPTAVKSLRHSSRRVGNAVRPARKALDLPAEPAASADAFGAAEPQAVRRHLQFQAEGPTMIAVSRFLFGRRYPKARGLAAVPGLAALMFVGHAWEDAGAEAAVPYIAIIVLSATYIIRPMVVAWFPLVCAFLWYRIAVARSSSAGSRGEWVFFLLLGFVPVAVLLIACSPAKAPQPVTSAEARVRRVAGITIHGSSTTCDARNQYHKDSARRLMPTRCSRGRAARPRLVIIHIGVIAPATAARGKTSTKSK
jgi:hypothetical protein